MEKSIYFHEDDYRQVEILPAENEAYCKRRAGLIDQFAEEHRSEAGFTNIYVRQENPLSLREKKLAKADLEQALKSHLSYYDQVYTGYSSYRELCQNTYAFALNENIAVYYAVEKDIIGEIWLSMMPETEDEVDLAQRVLETIGGLEELILADWNQGVVARLEDKEAVVQYLKELLSWWSELRVGDQ